MSNSHSGPEQDQPAVQPASSPALRVELELDPCLNLAMQQNGVALLKGLRIENFGESEVRDLAVRVRAEPAFCEPLELRLASLAAGAQHTWESPRLEPSPAFLAELRERLEGTLHVELVAGERALESTRRGVAVLAYDQWGGLRSLPELLCALVLPNHPAIVVWLKQAGALLEQWTGDPSLSGYQSKSRERVQQTAAAVFHALQASGITYVAPPASFERDGQKVRTPDRVDEERLATCLDLAVVVAACLEQAGLHALLVLVEGHAFAGVWLDETSFPEPAIEDAALLERRVELGEICVFDPTLVTARPVCGFDVAMAAARARLHEPQKFSCVIDVERARKGGLRPLPLRAGGVTLETTTEPRREAQAPKLSLPRRVSDRTTLETPDETPTGRIERWKRRLLDLTNRNRLLNFVESKKTAPLLCADLGRFEDALADGRVLTLRSALSEQQAKGPAARPVASETLHALLERELEAGRVVTGLGDDELDRRLTEIFRAAREGLEEGGASGLYVALGFLEWYESPTSERARLAPLILVPVDLQRGSIRQGFKLTRAADETRFNTTLVEMLSAQHHIQLTGIDPLPEDDRGVDVVGVLQQVRAALRDVKRWRVLEEARLGFFTFAKFLMWKDLETQSEVLLGSRVVSHLVRHPDQPFDRDWREPDYDTLDESHRAADLHCPVLADSSQLAAVIAAAEGKSFVLEGPPGTGKSQTITNLIAHCLARGKTVLFVSEKTAALNVVFDRLKKIGLERFCLELHSNKASKADVVRRLGEGLRGAQERTPEDWTRLADQLDHVRAELNAYARAIGRTHANGLSVFRATSLLTALRDAASIDLGWPDVGAVARGQLDDARAALGEAQNALHGTGDPHGHPLAGVEIEDVPPGMVERVREAFARLRAELDALQHAAGAPASALGFDLETASLRDLRVLDLACKLALSAPETGSGLIACEPGEAARLAAETCATGRRRDAVRSALTRQFDLRIVELDLLGLRTELRAASSAWFLGRWLQTRSIRKRLLGVTNVAATPSLAEMQTGVETALELASLQTKLTRTLADLSTRAGANWRDDTSPWPQIETVLGWTVEARASVLEMAESPVLAQQTVEGLARWLALAGGAGALRAQLDACRTALARVFEAAQAVANVLRLASDDPWSSPTQPSRAQAWRERMARIDPALTQLRAWALWRRLRARLHEHRLGALVSELERGRLRGDQLATSFDRSFYEAWLDWARAHEPALRDFLSLSHDQRIAAFRSLDERCTQLASKVVAAKLSARAPSANADAVPGSELGVLNRQLQLQRKHLGPRQLFQQTRTLVQKLKPCFLMSPISVAQYLPPGALSFDLVVFDEASQIPTWDAVGAIARGNQAIVVGDSKQLPPTSFFDAVVEDEDAEFQTLEELESILDECRAANVPPLDLRWHYRSRHESLITFSNRKYYDSRLSTFPAAAFEGLGVQWRHVPGGVYDKGRSRTNRGEAEALVAEVLRRLRDPQLARHSIGIVTFSSAQQLAVEDLLDEERREDPALDRFFIASEEVREPVFIKNLENVQGDERDVILFSICYGPDETGRVAMNFGPINQQGGERRLNVAVTRARRELVVFASLTADQIDLARSRARGVADLKLFLSYAQHGLRVLPAENKATAERDDFESPLEQEICEALRAAGHVVQTQIGCSGYRIDLAVVDPDLPGRFLLGIECDGANYHSARTARDRDRLRQSVLEGLGWTLIRVWSSDWWEARDDQLARLCAAIDQARQLARTPAPPSPPPAAQFAADTATMSAGARPLASAPLPAAPPSHPAIEQHVLPTYRARARRRLGSQEDFHDPLQSLKVQAELEAVVAEEGPISLGLAAARVAACFDFERTRQKVVDRIEQIASRARLQRTEQATGSFLWPNEITPPDWRGARSSAPGDPDARRSDELSIHEIANAAAHLLERNGACPRRDLQRALSRIFGFKALGAAVATHLDSGIEHLISVGRARVDADGRVEPAANS